MEKENNYLGSHSPLKHEFCIPSILKGDTENLYRNGLIDQIGQLKITYTLDGKRNLTDADLAFLINDLENIRKKHRKVGWWNYRKVDLKVRSCLHRQIAILLKKKSYELETGFWYWLTFVACNGRFYDFVRWRYENHDISQNQELGYYENWFRWVRSKRLTLLSFRKIWEKRDFPFAACKNVFEHFIGDLRAFFYRWLKEGLIGKFFKLKFPDIDLETDMKPFVVGEQRDRIKSGNMSLLSEYTNEGYFSLNDELREMLLKFFGIFLMFGTSIATSTNFAYVLGLWAVFFIFGWQKDNREKFIVGTYKIYFRFYSSVGWTWLLLVIHDYFSPEYVSL